MCPYSRYLDLKFLYRDPFKAKVSTIKVHGAFGELILGIPNLIKVYSLSMLEGLRTTKALNYPNLLFCRFLL